MATSPATPELEMEKIKLLEKRLDIEDKLIENQIAKVERLQYAKLAVTILIVLVLLYMFYTYFLNVKKQEGFAPYASALLSSTLRSDPDFDYQFNMPMKDIDEQTWDNKEFNHNISRMSSENKLFNQAHDLSL